MTIKVLFVCLGNICRSPTAHGVFQQQLQDIGLHKTVQVDSAGTAQWHSGKAPDSRSIAAAANRGYNLSKLRARQVNSQDFEKFDYVLAMDNSNLADLQAIKPSGFTGELGLFLAFNKDNRAVTEVPDPYYGDGDGFDQVLTLVEQAGRGLLQHIIQQHQLTVLTQ